MVNGPGWLEWWDDRGESFSYTFSRDELDNPPSPYYYSIQPVTDTPGWEVRDDWEVVNGGEVAIPGAQGGEFLIDTRLYDKYPDGTTFCYNFFNPSTATVTITVVGAVRNNNRWDEDPAKCTAGFSSSPIFTREQRTFNYGEQVTVYGVGKEIEYSNTDPDPRWGYYQVQGFYDWGHIVRYKVGNMSNTDSWTFKAIEDRTIYIEFKYVQ